MDREAAVIRAEMSQTRAQLDQKIALLEVKAREFSPKRYARNHMPEYFIDRVIGGVLTLVGVKMVLSRIKARRNHRAQVHDALAAYGRW
jgi:hypothetical protein